MKQVSPRRIWPKGEEINHIFTPLYTYSSKHQLYETETLSLARDIVYKEPPVRRLVSLFVCFVFVYLLVCLLERHQHNSPRYGNYRKYESTQTQ